MNTEEISERHIIVDIVNENKNSKYWKILASKINSLIETEENYINSFRSDGLNEKKIKDYNESVLKIKVLKNILNINEVILSENLSLLQKLKKEIENNKFIKSMFDRGRLFESISRT